MKNLILLASLIVLAGCSSVPTASTMGGLNEKEYLNIVNSQTKDTSQYDGFYQTFQASVTLLTTALEAAGLAQNAELQHWDAAKLQKERDRSFQEQAANTKVFVRLFTPENQYNDMQLPTSIWKIYLEHEGKRYEGKVKKATEKHIELKNRFPYFDRFSTGYFVTFALPTASAENSNVKIILTGPVGSAEFIFNKQ